MRVRPRRSLIAVFAVVASVALVGSGASLIATGAAGAASPSGSASTVGPAAAPAFSPQSIVWPTPSDGYLLGAVSCVSPGCPAEVLATHDGGTNWAVAARTHSPLARSGEPGLTSLQFADRMFGWAYDPYLEMTRNGGRSWTPVAVPGGDAKVLALLAAHDGTYLVTSGCAIGDGVCDDRPLKVWRAPGRTTRWQQLDIEVGATDHVRLAANDSAVLLLAAGYMGPGRLTTLRHGRVVSTSPVNCADQDSGGISDLATNAPGRIFVLCIANYGRGNSDKTLMVSGDGGRTFRYDTVPGSLGLGSLVAVSADGSVLISTLTASLVYNRPALTKSWGVDASWLENGERLHDLVFQSTTTAWLVEKDAAYRPDTTLWVTRDAGRTWQPTPILPA